MALACGLQDAAWGQRWKQKSNFLITRRWLRLPLLVASRTSRTWGCRKSVHSKYSCLLLTCLLPLLASLPAGFQPHSFKIIGVSTKNHASLFRRPESAVSVQETGVVVVVAWRWMSHSSSSRAILLYQEPHGSAYFHR
jgi:hypothetical protein